MKAQPACHQCFLRQARSAAELAGVSAESIESLVDAVNGELSALPGDVVAPVKATRVHALVRTLSGNPDPYREAKRAATEHALSLYPRLGALLASSGDPLDTALRLAVAGNIIDLGVASEYDLEASIRRVLDGSFAIDHRPRLYGALGRAKSVLYLADNAGETVMDRLLIEQLPQPVTYVVKGGPAVNDATRDDALAAGLCDVCEVIDSGGAMLGTLFEQTAPELRERFDAADLVIAKGMANYESLNGSRAGLFFLLQAKCTVIADHLDVPERGLVVMEDAPA